MSRFDRMLFQNENQTFAYGTDNEFINNINAEFVPNYG